MPPVQLSEKQFYTFFQTVSMILYWPFNCAFNGAKLEGACWWRLKHQYHVLLSLISVLSASPPLVCPRAPAYTSTGTNSTTDSPDWGWVGFYAVTLQM